jgi:P27 family predicted phage terminase small subunit
MAKGRKSIPKEIKELTGTLRADRHHTDIVSFSKITSVPAAPKELSLLERKMYVSICQDLIIAGVLESPDLDTVLKLVMENTKYYDCMKKMRLKGSYIITDPRSGKKVVNPLNTVANQALRNINSLSAELGLTPAARQRLKISTPPGEAEKHDPEADMKNLLS